MVHKRRWYPWFGLEDQHPKGRWKWPIMRTIGQVSKGHPYLNRRWRNIWEFERKLPHDRNRNDRKNEWTNPASKKWPVKCLSSWIPAGHWISDHDRIRAEPKVHSTPPIPNSCPLLKCQSVCVFLHLLIGQFIVAPKPHLYSMTEPIRPLDLTSSLKRMVIWRFAHWFQGNRFKRGS